MIPNIALVRIQSEHFWCPTIPVPLFLLWILALVLSPLIFLALLVVWAASVANGYPFWRAMAAFWRILCALPGTEVRVTAERNQVTVRIL